MLKLIDIAYSYDGRTPALAKLNADIPPGVTLLAGPNAGGKTTLLRLLAGLIRPDSGKVFGNAGEELSARDLRRMSRMVMQDAEPQILGSRVGEDVLLGANASNLEGDFPRAARDICRKMRLDELWESPVEALSYGQKRKLCLVHALAAGPEILLLDEPFAGLDYPSARELRRFIRENRRNGLHQIVSSHELDPVFDLADTVVVVEGGTARAQGSPAELKDRLGEWSIRAPGEGWD